MAACECASLFKNTCEPSSMRKEQEVVRSTVASRDEFSRFRRPVSVLTGLPVCTQAPNGDSSWWLLFGSPWQSCCLAKLTHQGHLADARSCTLPTAATCSRRGSISRTRRRPSETLRSSMDTGSSSDCLPR